MADAPNPNGAQGVMSSFGPAPAMTDQMTFKTVGQSGLRAFGGYVREEFLPQLQGRQAQTVYREMGDNSPVIGGMLFAIHAAFSKVEWRVVPAADTPEAQAAAEFVESLLEDMSDTWDQTVSESLSMVQFGFAPMEINYKRRMGDQPQPDPMNPAARPPQSRFDDGKIGWRNFAMRGQDTIIKWFFDSYGEWTGLTQQPWVSTLVDIPAEKLVLFRPTTHKSNPEGRSVLRNAYRPYYFIKRLEEQEAIMSERLNGLPVIRVPNSLLQLANGGDANAIAALQEYKNIVVNLRVDEQMGLILPSDVFTSDTGAGASPMYSFELVAPGGGKTATGSMQDPVIQRHSNQMMMSTLSDFMTLGHGKVGTQALSNSKEDMFFQSIEGWLNGTGAVFSRQALPRLWKLNGDDPDLMPEIQPDMAQRMDLDVLSNYVLRLGQSGMAMFPNADLESALMDAAGLPDIADSEAGELLAAGSEDQAMPPVPIAGPHAAAATAALLPKPEPEPPAEAGSPRDQLQKMIMASTARRMKKFGGLSSRYRKRR